MKTVQSFFLEQFEQPFRQNIISCCEKISNQNYDVIILLARKAACLFSVLEDLGLVSLNGIIVSDRVLMYNIEWLSGKRIAIIDDTIISGTTICKMIRQLKSIGANQIAVHALCIDDYWFVDNLLSESDKNYLQQSYMRVSHSMSIRFCKQIVNALSVVPRPYNIDFSINKSNSLTSRDFSLITECKEWKSVDTSTQLQHDNNIDCISLNFNRSFLNKFFSTLGGDYSKVLFAKIRVFTKFLDPKNKNGEIETKVVPYVIFNPIKVQFADDIIKAITDSENINTSVLSHFLTTNSSKLLFIQYYFAERLFIYWKSFIETIIDKSLTFKKEKKDLNLLFPPQIITLFQSFKYESQILLYPNESSEQFLYDNTERGKENTKINPYDVLGELSTKFLNLYYTKERIARRNVKRLKKMIFTDAEYVAVEKRLDNGPSLLDLVRTVAPFMHDTSDIMLMVSSFLDNAIDNGIAVPITVDNGTYLYRGFRHGEEVIWGDMADKLVASFFERIFGKEGKVTMLRFEKLLVLFLKFGIRREILKPFNYIPPLDKTKLLCVRSYLFGEIAVEHEFDPNIHKSQSSIENEFNPILTNECDTCWISTRYKAQNVLVKEDIGKKTYLRLNFDNLYYKKFDKEIIKDEPSDLDENIADKIYEIADVFKDCINNKLLNDDNLVTLTSCLHLKDNAASIGAELHIFYSEIGNYMCSVNSRLREYNMDVSFLKSLRDFKINKVWTAVNSGANKYISYKKHVASSIIKSVSDKLNSIDERTSRDWRKIWNTELELANSADLRLSELNDRMGLILYDILITLQYLHLLIYEFLNRNGANRQYLADCKERKRKYDIDIKRSKDDKELKQKWLDEKNRITKDLRNWEQYVDIDLEKTKSWINDLNEISSKVDSNQLALEVIHKSISNYSDDVLLKKFEIVNNRMDELKSLALQAIEDYKILLPTYSVVRSSVRYFSMLHLNISSSDPTKRQKIGMIIKRKLNDDELNQITESGEATMVLIRTDRMKGGGHGYVICSRGRSYKERLLKLGCLILKECCKENEKIIISFVPDISQNGIQAYFDDINKEYNIVYEDIENFLPNNKDESLINIYSRADSYKEFQSIVEQFHDEFIISFDDNNICGKIEYKPKKWNRLI